MSPISGDFNAGFTSTVATGNLTNAQKNFVKEMEQITFYQNLNSNSLTRGEIKSKKVDKSKIEEMHKEAINLMLELKPEDISSIGTTHLTPTALKFNAFMESITKLGFGTEELNTQKHWVKLTKDAVDLPNIREILNDIHVPLYSFALEAVNFSLADDFAEESYNCITHWVEACEAHFLASSGLAPAAKPAPKDDIEGVIEKVRWQLDYFSTAPEDKKRINQACDDLTLLLSQLSLEDIASFKGKETPNAQKFKEIMAVFASHHTYKRQIDSNLVLWSGDKAGDQARNSWHIDDGKSPLHSFLMQHSLAGKSPTSLLFRKGISAHFAGTATGQVHYFNSFTDSLEQSNPGVTQKLRNLTNDVVGVISTGNHFWDGELPVLQNLMSKGVVSKVNMSFYDKDNNKFVDLAELNTDSFNKIMLISRQDALEGKTPLVTVGKIKEIINHWKKLGIDKKE